jgi:hypothetical protein
MKIPKKCAFIKEDGVRCGCIAVKGSRYCRHKSHVGEDHSQTIGYVDRTLIEAEPGRDISFFDDYSTMEIHNYVKNATGGRVELPLHFSQEQMATQAAEVLS